MLYIFIGYTGAYCQYKDCIGGCGIGEKKINIKLTWLNVYYYLFVIYLFIYLFII